MATSKKSGGSKSGAKSSARGGGGAGRGESSGRGGSSSKGGSKGASAKGGSSRGGSASKGASKGGSSKSASKGGAKKAGAKRAPNPQFMKPMKPSESLAAVVGNNPMPRTEITKRLWDYIKKNNLQDPQQRRMINADDKLRAVFGGKKQVSMFDMTKLVNQNLSDS